MGFPDGLWQLVTAERPAAAMARRARPLDTRGRHGRRPQRQGGSSDMKWGHHPIELALRGLPTIAARASVQTERGRAMSAPTASRANLLIPGVIALALMVVLAISIPTDTRASHDFNDVPTNMLFHAEVSKISDAGITTGCGAGKFCPTEFVERRAMAAFMTRGFGRVALDDYQWITTIKDLDGEARVARIYIKVPGAGASATQFVEVRGRFVAVDTSAACSPVPCYVNARIQDDLDPGLPTATSSSALTAFDTIEASWVFAATPGFGWYSLMVETDAQLDLDLYDVVMTATTYPFGGQGGDVLYPVSVGEPVPLDAGTSSDGRAPLRNTLESSHLRDALEALREKGQ